MLKPFKSRNIYIERIRPYIDSNLIKVLIGQRRVGKSYVFYQLIDEIQNAKPKANIIYINKESYEFDNIVDYKSLIEFVEAKSLESDNYLFIDEVQDIELFEKALRHFSTTGRYDIYCTGSNAKLLSGEIATLLAGRYIQIRIFSLSYREFLDFHKLEDSDASLLEYIKYGGMPHLINLKKEEAVYYEYLKNIYNSIVLRDVVERYKIRNVSLLDNLIHFLCDNLGSIFSAQNISKYLKSQNLNIQSKTIIEYLSHLESVFFTDRVKRSEVAGKKIFEIGEKFYLEDLGLRHSIVPYQINDISKVLENLAYHHLKVMQYDVYVGKLGDKEIDFVAKKGDNTIYIQVAYMLSDESTRQREFGNLLEIEDNYRKILISMDPFADGNYKGIEHLHVRKFLMEFE